MADLNLRRAAYRAIVMTHEKLQAHKMDTDGAAHAEQMLIMLRQHWNTFMDKNNKLIAKAKEEEIDAHVALGLQAEELYNTCCVCLKACCTNTIAMPPASLQLDPLVIPTFDGEIHNWLPFKEAFETLIHNADLPDAYKLGKLREAVKPSQVPLVGGIYASGYSDVWAALKKRYDNRKQLAEIHVSKFLQIKLTQDETHKSLIGIVDEVAVSLRALRSMGLPVEQWDALTVPLIVAKLPKATRRGWCMAVSSTEIPKLSELLHFLEQRAQSVIGGYTSEPKDQNRDKRSRTAQANVAATANGQKCAYCEGDHRIYNCPTFVAMSDAQRLEAVRSKTLCFNCLKAGHAASQCKSGGCRQCGRKHNTLLCRTKPSLPDTSSSITVREEAVLPVSNLSTRSKGAPQTVLLATARVWAYNEVGESKLIRVLCDPGSQISFVTERLAMSLRLRRRKEYLIIEGIGTSAHTRSVGSTTLTLRSTHSSYMIPVNASIIPTIVRRIPSVSIDIEHWAHLVDIPLADPSYGTPDNIDALLGADIWGQTIQDSTLHGKDDEPHAQKTQFGWVIFGKAINRVVACVATNPGLMMEPPLEEIFSRFWKYEEVPDYETTLEDDCDHIFRTTHTRTSEGRYVVKIPLKTGADSLGDSYTNALRSFNYLERKLRANAELHNQYVHFMREYLRLGHMIEVVDPVDTEGCYYIPHHAVTSKFRVVFNASAKTSSGLSLNDIQLVGPTIQDSLVNIILRFRRYRIALTADVEKMFRQVLVAPEHRDLQRILWRESATDSLKTYQLVTVTYGMASSPYNAVRALQQCAKDNSGLVPNIENSQMARDAILSNFYVDDWLTSCSSGEKALQLANDVDAMLLAGHFRLRKWSSNDAQLAARLNGAAQAEKAWNLEESVTSVLGLHWSPSTDEIIYTFNRIDSPATWNNRRALSHLARLFDPIGLLSPVVIRGKIFIQTLWASGADWDSPLETELLKPWTKLCDDLESIKDISIPRWLGMTDASEVRIHGFCDASLRAYAAAIYIQIKTENGWQSTLMTARTKVAPLKGGTIPCLELCGAQLLVSTLRTTIIALGLVDIPYYLWTDSQVVLCWLQRQPTLLKQYVGNRVRYIQENTLVHAWRHVRSADNPADCASRGLTPKELVYHPLWWHGPSWLPQFSESVQSSGDSISSDERQLVQSEEKPIALVATITTTFPVTIRLTSGAHISLLDRFSHLPRLLHMTAYVLRWRPDSKKRGQRVPDAPELRDALNFLIAKEHSMYFGLEINHIQLRSRLPNSSRLLPLNPFMSEDGLLRVGGRLSQADLPFERRCPIVLAKRSTMARLIIRKVHLETHHGGTQLMLRVLRSEYWILQGRQAVRSHIHACVVCRRHRGATLSQQMAPLPDQRVNPARPFLASGVDYCGPFMLRVGNKRSRVTTKSYLAIFVCMATKAVHIEVVDDLSTSAFLDAYTRFISRRGLCRDLYTDNATTFVGANRFLKEDLEAWHSEATQIAMANLGTTWHFIAPRAPHQGGIWEAAVKSAKRHLIRVIGTQALWFGQFQTLAARIEACLNSRPITPLTDDPDDKYALTPGDFLIGAPLLAVPEPSLESIPHNRIRHWQWLRQLHQQFWRRWSEDYLHTLQIRSKWYRSVDPIRVGDIVLVKDENLSPTHWRLGRVTAVHPGRDNLIRNVTLRSAGGEFTRAVQKICLLLENPPLEQTSSTGQDVGDYLQS